MAQFKIKDSKVEQLNESGNNYKITGASGNLAISQQGGTVQSTGDGNRTQVDHKATGGWSFLWRKIKGCWSWLAGHFGS